MYNSYISTYILEIFCIWLFLCLFISRNYKVKYPCYIKKSINLCRNFKSMSICDFSKDQKFIAFFFLMEWKYALQEGDWHRVLISAHIGSCSGESIVSARSSPTTIIAGKVHRSNWTSTSTLIDPFRSIIVKEKVFWKQLIMYINVYVSLPLFLFLFFLLLSLSPYTHFLHSTYSY